MNEWQIRVAEETDVASVLSLWQAAGVLPTVTDNAGALRALLARDADSLLLAEVGEEVVGSLIASWDGWRGSFYRLAVRPDWRRRGIAKALVRAGEDRLRGLGAVRLTAIVADDQGAATALWKAMGYRRQSETGRFVLERP